MLCETGGKVNAKTKTAETVTKIVTFTVRKSDPRHPILVTVSAVLEKTLRVLGSQFSSNSGKWQ
jgi:hypothetical protein